MAYIVGLRASSAIAVTADEQRQVIEHANRRCEYRKSVIDYAVALSRVDFAYHRQSHHL
jgi:hypothetical protein